MKDFEKFKAYYCGLCKSIKKQYGNLPRAALNYDMTFLGILLDSLDDRKCTFEKQHCFIHPLKTRLVIVDNKALTYAAYCNVTLAYYKLIDNIQDDNSLASKIGSVFLKKYLKHSNPEYNKNNRHIENNLKELSSIEKSELQSSLDEISHPFADLTASIISCYLDNNTFLNDMPEIRDNLYWLGYNLGKWIYIIDAWDDLQKDMSNNKFNPLNKTLNLNGETFDVLKDKIEERIDFLLVACASRCVEHLNNLPLVKNKELLNNILQYGLMEKMDTVFKRSELENAKSL